MARKKHSQQLMKAYNENLVYNNIRLKGPVSRADISRTTQMSATNVGRIVDNLIDAGLVRETGTLDGMVGRRPTMLQVKPEGILVIAAAVDYARVEVGLVDICGNISHSAVIRAETGMSQREVIDHIKTQVNRVIGELDDRQLARVRSVGISVPGVVKLPEGIVTSPQLGWRQVPMKELCDVRGFEVVVENAVKAAATAEHMFGCAKDENNYVSLAMGTGIGAALMFNGEIFRGANNIAGEVGHVIVEPGGMLCDCGRRGCLQSTLCILGLERKTGMRYEDMVERAAAGDSACEAILGDVAEHLSRLVANMANLYDLPLIILYGEMLEYHRPLFQEIRSRYQKYMWGGTRQSLEIRKSGIGIDVLPLLSAASTVFCSAVASDVVIR